MNAASRPRRLAAADAGRLWWRDGAIYQVYPRSFADANGDGSGDLEGIRQRLDHLAWLGIADYCDVDPIFGTLADFDRLLADAHARGIRVILDRCASRECGAAFSCEPPRGSAALRASCAHPRAILAAAP
jgi:alpha-glucosidase